MHLTGKGCGFVFSYIHAIRILLSPEFLSFDIVFVDLSFVVVVKTGMGNYGTMGQWAQPMKMSVGCCQMLL